jgi:hypothetical protein
MVIRGTGHAGTMVTTEPEECLSLKRNEITALNDRRVQEKPGIRFHLSVSTDKKIQARRMIKQLQKSPLGRLITAIATTPQLRPEKMEQGRKVLQCSDAQLEEKLLLAMEHVIEELSHSGRSGNNLLIKQKST